MSVLTMTTKLADFLPSSMPWRHQLYLGRCRKSLGTINLS